MKSILHLIILLVFFSSCASKKTNFEPDDLNKFTKNAVIYEVNVRQYSKEGNFNKVTNDLQRIKDLGVDIIWLMPIHPIGELNRKGTLGSYYAVKDYKAVNPQFGTLNDFKKLVNKAHSLKMKVIIDWVANHSSPDNVWIKDHLDYYTKDENGNAPIPTVGTDWTDVADLNYYNPELQIAMQDAMIYWVKETDIDGYRCDVAEFVPLEFWKNTRKKLNEIKPVFMLAEGAKYELFEAFDMIYGWEFKDLMLDVAKQKKSLIDFASYRSNAYKNIPENAKIMYFTSNHDENSWSYLEKDVFGNNKLNYASLTALLNGMPLVYNGQESGLDKKLSFFEKDQIDWGTYKYTSFYQNLFAIYKQNEALWNGKYKGTFRFYHEPEFQLFVFEVYNKNNSVFVIQNYENKNIYYNHNSILKTYETEEKLWKNKVEYKGDLIVIPANTTFIFTKNIK